MVPTSMPVDAAKMLRDVVVGGVDVGGNLDRGSGKDGRCCRGARSRLPLLDQRLATAGREEKRHQQRLASHVCDGRWRIDREMRQQRRAAALGVGERLEVPRARPSAGSGSGTGTDLGRGLAGKPTANAPTRMEPWAATTAARSAIVRRHPTCSRPTKTCRLGKSCAFLVIQPPRDSWNPGEGG